MRRLGRGAAKRCEEATEPKCACRCGGQFHGARRGATEDLPLDDPHSTKRTRCEYGRYVRCGRPAVTERHEVALCATHRDVALAELAAMRAWIRVPRGGEE